MSVVGESLKKKRIYNTMSQRMEEFAPSGDEVKIYVCCITPYDRAHLWHAMSYIIFFFFFKQKTAYEMLSGDWSSDVCSSDHLFARESHRGGVRSRKREDLS